MIIEAIQALAGLIFVFCIPGWLMAELFFTGFKGPEKILSAILLSISFYVFLGMALGFSLLMKSLTGGLSTLHVWAYSIAANGALALLLYYRKHSKGKHLRKEKHRSKP